MNSNNKNIIKRKKLDAMKKFLNKMDITDFSKVPDHIVEAFFEKASYKSRMLVTVFVFVNGININQLFELLKKKLLTKEDKTKIIYLFNALKNPVFSYKYYSYNVIRNLIIFCNGDIRRYGKRIEKIAF